MILINKRWYDESGNSWNAEIYSEERAEERSKTLKNCSGCSDCTYCNNCVNCNKCYRCFGCSACFDCQHCSECFDCSRCISCSLCLGIYSLYGCWTQPQIYMTDRIGSRKMPTIFYRSKDHSECRVVCGCWGGSLEEFAARVAEVHGDNEHGKTYAEAIRIAQIIFGVPAAPVNRHDDAPLVKAPWDKTFEDARAVLAKARGEL